MPLQGLANAVALTPRCVRWPSGRCAARHRRERRRRHRGGGGANAAATLGGQVKMTSSQIPASTSARQTRRRPTSCGGGCRPARTCTSPAAAASIRTNGARRSPTRGSRQRDAVTERSSGAIRSLGYHGFILLHVLVAPTGMSDSDVKRGAPRREAAGRSLRPVEPRPEARRQQGRRRRRVGPRPQPPSRWPDAERCRQEGRDSGRQRRVHLPAAHSARRPRTGATIRVSNVIGAPFAPAALCAADASTRLSGRRSSTFAPGLLPLLPL